MGITFYDSVYTPILRHSVPDFTGSLRSRIHYFCRWNHAFTRSSFSSAVRKIHGRRCFFPRPITRENLLVNISGRTLLLQHHVITNAGNRTEAYTIAETGEGLELWMWSGIDNYNEPMLLWKPALEEGLKESYVHGPFVGYRLQPPLPPPPRQPTQLKKVPKCEILMSWILMIFLSWSLYR
jgi:hypothetical protein